MLTGVDDLEVKKCRDFFIERADPANIPFLYDRPYQTYHGLHVFQWLPMSVHFYDCDKI